MKILVCDLQFKLFDDNNDKDKLKKILWKPRYIHEKNIDNDFDNYITCKECYILNKQLVIIFEIDP